MLEQAADRVAARTFAVFGARDFRLLWFSSAACYAARWTDDVTTGWLVLELTSSPVFLSLVGASRHLPLLLLGVFGGLLADRVAPRTVLIVSVIVELVITTWLSFGASLQLLAGGIWCAPRRLS